MKVNLIGAIIAASIFFMPTQTNAQFFKKLADKAADAAERTINRRVEEESAEHTDKALDKVFEREQSNKKRDRKRAQSNKNNKQDTNSMEVNSGALEEVGGSEVNFKRGTTILYSDNFSKDALGDFPAKWNTNRSGNVVKLRGFNEKFLKIPAGSMVNLQMTKPFPPNFTVEFDIIIPRQDKGIATFAFFGFLESLGTPNLVNPPGNGIAAFFEGGDVYGGNTLRYGSDRLGYHSMKYEIPYNKKMHVAIEVNNHKRMRVYVDGAKMIDLPTKFKPEFANNFFINNSNSGNYKNGICYVSNVLITETGTDRRSSVQKELLEKGTFTTSDITFASGSDNINASSADILNEIAEAMNSIDANFMIIGHTDSDGSESSNQLLSEKRAKAVKNYLISNFGIDADRLHTKGKGESDPVASNKTSEGKAQNRRVEFVKM